MGIFEDMSLTALGVMSDASCSYDATNILTTSNGSFALDVVIDKDVEIINKNTEAISDNALIVANTATFKSTVISVGDSLRVQEKTWMIGQTLEDDGFVMTVIVT